MKSPSKYIIGPTFQKGHLSLIIACLLTVAFAQSVVAEEAHEGAAHEFHRHHMALILGNTQNDGSEHGLSVGVDYVYHINSWLGIGGLVEYAGGDFKHFLLMAPLVITPYKGWVFNVAPGTEVHKEHGDHEEDKRERDWVVRTGVAYQFHFGERYLLLRSSMSTFPNTKPFLFTVLLLGLVSKRGG